jgi:putative transposase
MATRPLQIGHIDHTQLDIFVVAEEDGMPIGRPHIELIVDSLTMYPLGYCIYYAPGATGEIIWLPRI